MTIKTCWPQASGEGRRSSNGINWRWLSLNQKIVLFLGNLCGLKLFRHLINHEPKVECFLFLFHLRSKLYQYSEAVVVDELEKVFCTLPETHFYTLVHLTLFPDVMLKFCLQNNNKRKPRKSIDTLNVCLFVCVCEF